MLVQQTEAKIEENETFHAVVNAFLTKPNIDGPSEPNQPTMEVMS
jgi:hypothetical protein